MFIWNRVRGLREERLLEVMARMCVCVDKDATEPAPAHT